MLSQKNEPRISGDKLIVKIFNVDVKTKTTSAGGIITSHPLNPVLDYCQIGECLGVGNGIPYIKKGEMVLFRWGVEHDDESFLERDDDAEYRFVNEAQLIGSIKNDKYGNSHIQPKKHYFVAQPREKDFALTRSIFQIPVMGLNPMDTVPKMMGLSVGDLVVCRPYSAVPVTVQRKVFFFVYLEDVLFINKSEYKISINRKHVSKDLRLASRNNKVNLN